MSEALTRKPGLASSTAANAASPVVAAVVAIGLSPFIVHELGLKVFGFWSIVSALTQYSALLDFGIGAALARFVALHNGLGDRTRIESLAAAAATITWPVAGLVVLLSIGFVTVVPDHWSAEWPNGWEVSVMATSVALSCMLISSAYLAFARGLGRWDLSAVASITYQLVFAAGTVVFLVAGRGIAGLGLATLAASVAMLIAAVVSQRVVWRAPLVVTGPASADIKELLTYGGNLQLSALTSIVNSQADKPVILAVGGSLEFVGLYELASRLANQARALPVAALGPLTVKFAGETAGQALEAAQPLYEWALRNILTLAVAPMLIVYGLGYPLVMAWLGPEFKASSEILIVLGLAYAANLGTGAGSTLSNAMGRPDLERNYCLLSLALNVSGSLMLGWAFGPWGVVCATSASMIGSSLWFHRRVVSWLGTETPWVSSAAREAVPSLGLAGALGILTITATVLIQPTNRIGFILTALLCGVISWCVWAAAVPDVRRLLSRALNRVYRTPASE